MATREKKADTKSALLFVASAREFGARVRHYRELKGLTLKELADAVMYKHYTSISRIEAGNDRLRITLRRLILMAQVFGISLAELIRGLKL